MATKLPIGHQVIVNPKDGNKNSLATTHRDKVPSKQTKKK